MVDVLSSDYVRTARAMGLREKDVVFRYALRNAMPVVLNVFGLIIIGQLGSTVILEQIFVLPGLGSAVYSAIQSLDYTLLQGAILFFIVIVVVVNLAVDVLSGLLDPRLRN
jgi:peptide/nickel transport system permease protein